MLKRRDNSSEIDIHICVYQRNADIIAFSIDADDDKKFHSGNCLFSLRRYPVFWIKLHPENASNLDLCFFQHFDFTQ